MFYFGTNTKQQLNQELHEEVVEMAALLAKSIVWENSGEVIFEPDTLINCGGTKFIPGFPKNQPANQLVQVASICSI